MTLKESLQKCQQMARREFFYEQSATADMEKSVDTGMHAYLFFNPAMHEHSQQEEALICQKQVTEYGVAVIEHPFPHCFNPPKQQQRRKKQRL